MNNKYEYVEPLSSADKAFIMKVLRYLAVELGTLASEADILSAIKASGFKCLPRGVLATMILHGYAKTEGDDKVRLIIKEKGGEKMVKNYNTRNTSGEAKIAKAILEKCDFESVPSVSKESFKKYLEKILPDINKKVKPHLALKVMLRGKYIIEKDGNITLGEDGKELLSH